MFAKRTNTKLIDITITFIFSAFVVIYSVIGYIKINKNYADKTQYALSMDTTHYSKQDMQEDMEFIKDNYGFYQLRTENQKMQQDLSIKKIWTYDLIAFAITLLALKCLHDKRSDN